LGKRFIAADANADRRAFHLPDGGYRRSKITRAGEREICRAPDDIERARCDGPRRQSNHQEDTMKTRLSLGLGASAAAALVTAALMASAGSAQAPPTVLHLVGTPQKGVGFGSPGPRQGARVGFGSTTTGDDTGYDRGVCTAMKGGLLCTIQVQLSKGTLTAQGILPQRANRTPVAITGGTGAYDGARGTALVTDKKNQTEVDVTLLP
jgi:hypothetical protein